MIDIQIDEDIRTLCSSLAIGWIEYYAAVPEHSTPIWDEIKKTTEAIRQHYRLESVSALPEISEGRAFYKRCGKDPARYRISSESLLRRILQGKSIDPINGIVDLNNLISIRSGLPVCSYDAGQLSGSVIFRIGKSSETFQGIRKGLINLEGLPVFSDALGPFGSPTHDSERSMVTLKSRWLVTKIISFTGGKRLTTALDELHEWLKETIKADVHHIRMVRIQNHSSANT